jgi:hypothetical protein
MGILEDRPGSGNSGAEDPRPRDVRQAAIDAQIHGISVVPPTEDGQKRPFCPWKCYQDQRAALDQLRVWYGVKGPPRRCGLGAVCGAVSGNLEAFEFDRQGAAYAAFQEAARALGLGDLVDRLEAGYSERSPSGGIHWLYRCEKISGNTPLALYESEELNDQGQPILKPIIETRGEGGYIVLAPSNGQVHPTGQAYVLVAGGFASIPTITPEERQALFDLARTFDERPPGNRPALAEATEAKRSWAEGAVLTPGDDYNARTTWGDLLEPLGWTLVYRRGHTDYWRRPGKDKGHSATTNHRGTDRLHVFTSSSTFQGDMSYSRFWAYANLHHQGDLTAATRALSQAGYGTFQTWVEKNGQWVLETRPNPCPKGVRIARPGEGPPARARARTDTPALTTASGAADDPFEGLSEADLGILAADQLEPERVEWLWENRIALGKINLLAGEGGDGKSQLAIALAAAITTGGPMPDGSASVAPGFVFILAAEDGMKDTIIPRLIAAGADLTRVRIITNNLVKIKGRDGKLMISPMSFQDLAYWRKLFRLYPDLRLMIADPIPAFLGRGVNDHKNADIRAVLEPFAELLSETRVALLGITHLGKTTELKSPVHRILGSVAYANLARSVHITVRDREDKERRFLCHPKVNVGKEQPTRAYRIETYSFTHNGQEISTSRVVFDTGIVEADITSLLAGRREAKRRGPQPTKTNEIAEWLHDFLVEQKRPVPLAAIFDAAGEKGFVGEKKEDGKWSIPAGLYRARDAIPSLPEPRGGRIEELSMPVRDGGRNTLHWYLVSIDAAF